MGILDQQSNYINSAVLATKPVPTPRHASISRLETRYQRERTVRKTLQGSVILMKNRATGQKVAVKTAMKNLVASKVSESGVRVAEDIVNEVQLLQTLSQTPCPNVIQMLDYIQDDAQHALVLEYASGGELFDYIEQNGAFSERTARSVMKGIFKGVAYMHKRGICHLDLSPENVLLNGDNTPKVCDLGLARHYRSGFQFRGDPASRPGKLTYMSPEIFTGDNFYGPAADVWSLGVLMFVVLFGFPPFEIAHESDVRYAFLCKNGLRALLMEWNLEGTISGAACDLISSMLTAETQRISLASIVQHPWITASKTKI